MKKILILLMFLFLVPAAQAVFYVRVHNGTGSTVTFYLTRNGTAISSAGVGASSTYEWSIGDSAWVTGQSLQVWTGSYGGTPVYRTDTGSDVYVFGEDGPLSAGKRVPASPYTFSNTETPPEWSYKLEMQNNHSVTKTYKIKDSSGATLGVIIAGPGGSSSEVLGPYPMKIEMTIEEEISGGVGFQYIGDGMYADIPFYLTVIPQTDPGWYSVDVITTTKTDSPVQLPNAFSPEGSQPINFTGAPNSTNLADNLTMQEGFQGLATIQQGAANRLILETRTLAAQQAEQSSSLATIASSATNQATQLTTIADSLGEGTNLGEGSTVGTNDFGGFSAGPGKGLLDALQPDLEIPAASAPLYVIPLSALHEEMEDVNIDFAESNLLSVITPIRIFLLALVTIFFIVCSLRLIGSSIGGSD